METQKIETYLPLFKGFYNTIFEPDEEQEIYNINDERASNNLDGITYDDDIQFDYDTYKNEVCIECVSFVEEKLAEIGIVKSITFQKLVSPRYYNYSNDSINVEIEVVVPELKKYLEENIELFGAFLNANYSSYDGFIPSHSNDVSDWSEELNDFTDFSVDGHKLGSTLEFVLGNSFEGDDLYEEMYYYCIDNDCSLSCMDYQHETTKIKCDECGEWYSNNDLIEKYNYAAESELAFISDRCDIKPTVRSFEEWVKNNGNKHCE